MWVLPPVNFALPQIVSERAKVANDFVMAAVGIGKGPSKGRPNDGSQLPFGQRVREFRIPLLQDGLGVTLGVASASQCGGEADRNVVTETRSDILGEHALACRAKGCRNVRWRCGEAIRVKAAAPYGTLRLKKRSPRGRACSDGASGKKPVTQCAAQVARGSCPLQDAWRRQFEKLGFG